MIFYIKCFFLFLGIPLVLIQTSPPAKVETTAVNDVSTSVTTTGGATTTTTASMTTILTQTTSGGSTLTSETPSEVPSTREVSQRSPGKHNNSIKHQVYENIRISPFLWKV